MRLISYLFKPVGREPVFYLFLITLLTPRTFLYFTTHPADWLTDWYEFPTVRYISIAAVYAYFLTLIVSISKSFSIKLIIYFIAYCIFFLNLFLAINFHASISANTLLLALETTSEETRDFLEAYGLTLKSCLIYVVLLIILLINYYCERSSKQLLQSGIFQRQYFKEVIKCILITLLICGFFFFKVYSKLLSGMNMEEVEAGNLHELPHMDLVTGLISAVYTLGIAEGDLKVAVTKTLEVKKGEYGLLSPDDTCNVIFVLGESFIKRHSSLYGYYLPTNQRLQKEKDSGRMIVLSDVVTPSLMTSFALRNVFSCNSIGDGEKWYERPLFPAIFKAAGYHVFFWDNQYKLASNAGADFSLNSYIHNKEITELSYDMCQGMISNYDDDIIVDFENRFSKLTMGVKNFFIFHLQGQHFLATNHYPPKSEFNHFTINDIKREDGWMNEKKKQEIADYDNCTFYNDSVIYHIISIFKTKPSVMVYLSDHGENIYDVDNSIGRRFDLTEKDAEMVKCLHEVPLFVWYSDSYKSNNEMIIGDLNEAKDKPMMTDNVCHLLMRLGGVNSSCYNSSRDISTDDYKCPPRIVGNHVNFDKLY